MLGLRVEKALRAKRRAHIESGQELLPSKCIFRKWTCKVFISLVRVSGSCQVLLKVKVKIARRKEICFIFYSASIMAQY